MYSRILKDVKLDDKPAAGECPRAARIIPADRVVVRPAERGKSRLDKSEIEMPRESPDSPAYGANTGTEEFLLRAAPYDHIFVNQLVEARVREFETRFQREKEAAFKEGMDQGYGKGYREGTHRVKDLENVINNMNREFAAFRDDLLSQSEKAIARLVIEIAETIIGEAVMKSSKELLDYNLKRCLEALGGSGKVIIRISPSDYEFAEEHLLNSLGKESERFNFEFKTDPKITPGGCLIETGGGGIDARIETQFEQIKNSFLQLV